MGSSGSKGMNELSATLLTEPNILICSASPGESLTLVSGNTLIILKLAGMQWSEVKWYKICSESGPLGRRWVRGNCHLMAYHL